MSRRSNFTQAELTRAIRGAIAAGLAVTHCEIGRDGTIVLSAAAGNASADTQYDKWKAQQ